MKIKTIKNGPLLITGLKLKDSKGNIISKDEEYSLCRCGHSKNKPFCDGTHSKINWDDSKKEGRQPRKDDKYKGKKITVHDDRGICAHVGFCTSGLPKVFRMKKEPWIDPDEESKDKVINQIKKCPSGALVYSIDGKLYNVFHDNPGIKVTRNGPYFIFGGPNLDDSDKPQSPEHYALCRCGHSKNKPFCDGSHWYEKFNDGEDEKDAQAKGPKEVKGEEFSKEEIKMSNTKASKDSHKRNDNFIPVGKEKDFEEGKGKLVEVEGKKIAMFKYKGKIGAISHKCAHQGGPLADGKIKNGSVVCPWHGWEFDPITGKAPKGFDDSVPAYEVKVEDNEVFVSSEPIEKSDSSKESKEVENSENGDYLSEWSKKKDEHDPIYETLQYLAKTGKSSISAMKTLRKITPNWDCILFKGAQLSKMPLNEIETVNTKTIIGPNAKIPLKIDIPFYVSHMSFGALSREAKIALAKGSAKMKTVMCSGEGGMLSEEQENAYKYIYEVGTAMFNHKEDAIKKADAIEIKIGQSAKPGMGGHLPKEKITDEIAKIRGIKKGEDFISPGRHADINSKEDLKKEVEYLRKMTGGKPIGIKFSAGHIEEDIDVALEANPDFITIDCRGGATGAAYIYIKDEVCVPPIFAIRRARRHLDKKNSKATLCVTGGFRTSSDIAKAIALGADVVALATASLIAIGCQQYRICHTGNCPVGITTQKKELRERFVIEKSVERFINFYSATKKELENFARINGVNNVHKLSIEDIMTTSNEISENTDIKHV